MKKLIFQQVTNLKATNGLGYILVFSLFGLVVGLVSIWHDERGYDTPFLLNLPGALIGDTLSGIWHRLFGIGTPWFIANPQVVVWTSVLFWSLVGFILIRFVKPKTIAWIVGTYLLIFGGLTIAYYA